MSDRQTPRILISAALAAQLLCLSTVLAADPPATPATPGRNSTEITLDVDVRSSVDRPFQGLRKAPLKANGKHYSIAALSLAPSVATLVRPVDEGRMLLLLRQELSKRGFREFAGGKEPPEIILTVIYGRGWLKNPYMSYMTETPNSEFGSGNVVTISGADPHFLRSKEFRFEEKLQKANYEKLFIRVTAWKYPDPKLKDPKGKKSVPRELWKTDMILDDPDNRDLNQFIEEMFAAGSAFFDREMDKEEITVSSVIPEGRVILAPLEFPDETSSAKPSSKK